MYQITARYTVEQALRRCDPRTSPHCAGPTVNSSGINLVYASCHCHAPSCISCELWNADTGDLICRQVPKVRAASRISRALSCARLLVAGAPPHLWADTQMSWVSCRLESRRQRVRPTPTTRKGTSQFRLAFLARPRRGSNQRYTMPDARVRTHAHTLHTTRSVSDLPRRCFLAGISYLRHEFAVCETKQQHLHPLRRNGDVAKQGLPDVCPECLIGHTPFRLGCLMESDFIVK